MDFQTLKYKYQASSVVIKLIVINVAIFLIVSLGSFFIDLPQSVLTKWFVLPSNLGRLLMQPWSLLSYSFLHAGISHILWNMLFLYWFGPMVLNLFPGRRFLTLYFLGALSGGVLFVVAYNVFPVFTNSLSAQYLIGASAAVRAVMIFIAAYTPHSEIRFFFFKIKLWHIAVFVIALDLIQIPVSNAGGNIAHLGGAIFGYLYAVQLQKGRDIGLWWEKGTDLLIGLLHRKPKTPFKKVYKNPKKDSRKTNDASNNGSHQEKVNIILEKISKSGYDSLTKTEKEFLFKAGNK